MKKIMFNDKYGLTRAVLEGRKTQTRRIAYTGNATIIDCGICVEPKNIGRATLFRGIDEVAYSRYNVGEEVAIAQSYKDIHAEILRVVGDLELKQELLNSKGYTNKMFVRADKMLHRIRITDIRAERLQEISDEDCIAEGIKKNPEVLRGMWEFSYIKDVTLKFEMSTTPRGAYAKLIDHISGKGTWESNPYVFVYEFELIK